MHARVVPLLLLSIVIFGCASVDKSISSIGSTTATVTGMYEQRPSHILPQEILMLAVVGFDDRPVTKNFFSDPHQMIVRADAGQHQIRIEVSRFERCAKPSTTGAIVQLNASLEAGRNYKLQGRAHGGSITVWLEDQASGSRTADEATGKLAWKDIPIYPSAMIGC